MGIHEENSIGAANPAQDSIELPTGYRLQEYVIAKTIGTGGFGITYLGKDSNLDKNVAIKEYFPFSMAIRGLNYTVRPRTTIGADINQYQWGLDRFIDEARTLAQFEHKNLIRVIRYLEQNNTAYIIMEFASGKNLSDVIKENGPFDGPQLKNLILPLLDGLEIVHKEGVLHRDIKPENIIIRPDNSPVLIDFGAARQAIGAKSQQISAILTPGYAPYEQYSTQGKNQGPWTDIYALGAVAYSCLTGKTPVEASERNFEDCLIPAEKEGKGYAPLPLLKAIDWSMRVHFRDRPQDVAQWRAAIQGGDIAPPAPSTDGQTVVLNQDNPAPQATASVRRKGLGMGSIIAILLVVMVGAIGYSYWQSENNSTSIKNASSEPKQAAPQEDVAALPKSQAAPAPQKNTRKPGKSTEQQRKQQPSSAKPEPTPAEKRKILAETQDFQTAQYINTSEAYEIFLRLHPKGKNSPAARQRLINSRRGSMIYKGRSQ